MNASDYMQALALAVGAIAWLVKIEVNQKTDRDNLKERYRLLEHDIAEVQKDVDDLRIRHEGLDSKIIAQLSAVRESLARLEGRLGIKYEDN